MSFPWCLPVLLLVSAAQVAHSFCPQSVCGAVQQQLPFGAPSSNSNIMPRQGTGSNISRRSLRALHAYRSLSERRSDDLGLDSQRQVLDVRIVDINRPLGKTRTNDAAKVAWLMESIAEVGQQVPIDVLLVEGKYFGFSGCHRFEACQRLGKETIKCRVIAASREVLHMHMR